MLSKILQPTPKQVIDSIKEFVFLMEDNFPCIQLTTANCLDNLLKTINWKYLECGTYARVYLSPCGNYVLKVNIEYDPYPFFAEMALNDSANPYLPNIYWHVPLLDDFTAGKTVKSVTLIERLEHMDNNEFKYHPKFTDFIINIEEYSKFPKCRKIGGYLGRIACGFNRISHFTDFEFDLQARAIDNIMLRGEQLVIIDPIRAC